MSLATRLRTRAKSICPASKRQWKARRSPKNEQAILRQEETVRTAQYDFLREKLNQILNVKYCIEEVKHEERKKQQIRQKNQQLE